MKRKTCQELVQVFPLHLIIRKKLLNLVKKKEAGTKVLDSQLFWIVEQDAVVEWALLR